MGINIGLPNITGNSTPEQLRQLQSYLFQMVEQLNWALNSINTQAGNAETESVPTTTVTQEDASINTFNDIKGLIIKSADIVNAYYEEIDNLLKLSGEYVAEATFPEGSATFVQNTKNTLKATSDSLVQYYENTQKIISKVDLFGEQLRDVKAYIKSGLLYTDNDGVPIYGLEIGQKTEKNGEEVFNQYARFIANRLTFYDSNGYPAAYISDKKLFVDNVEVNISFSMGGFVNTVRPIDKSVVTKWIGGS